MQLEPGLHLFQHSLDAAAQRHVWTACRQLAAGPVPMYTPTVRGGRKMSVGMLCLGRHWNALTYRYEARRTDFDDLPVPPVPPDFAAIAIASASRAGFTFTPDLCIMNFYDAESRMGIHQDKDESRASIEAGAPIVSISLGDTARFVVGGLRRKDQVHAIELRSGDVLVMGGPSRLRYHGVTRIVAGTAPDGLGPGRFNLTFRQY
jgi:alkylated DNA repair protein (DNA oxidative demethylase)